MRARVYGSTCLSRVEKEITLSSSTNMFQRKRIFHHQFAADLQFLQCNTLKHFKTAVCDFHTIVAPNGTVKIINSCKTSAIIESVDRTCQFLILLIWMRGVKCIVMHESNNKTFSVLFFIMFVIMCFNASCNYYFFIKWYLTLTFNNLSFS